MELLEALEQWLERNTSANVISEESQYHKKEVKTSEGISNSRSQTMRLRVLWQRGTSNDRVRQSNGCCEEKGIVSEKTTVF